MAGENPPIRSSSASRVFTGETLYVVCSEVSGQECDRPMPADAIDCGVSSHIRIVPVGGPRGEATFRSRTRPRPSIVVEEDYELLPEERGPRVEFDPATFDADGVWVATRVQSAFTSFHGVSADEAIVNVRLLLKLAAADGRHADLESGGHRLRWRGYEAVLTPDLGTVTGYRTQHFERTPKMVAQGVRSRIRKGRIREAKRKSSPLPDGLSVGTVLDGPIKGVMNYGVFVDVGGVDGLVHKSAMIADSEDPRTAFAVGEILRVEVISIDQERRRIGLRMLVQESSEFDSK